MQALQRQFGFTLIELMVVIAIMGIMLAFAVPSVVRYSRQEEARAQSHIVAAALRNARDRSIREGVQHFVLFGTPPPGSPAGAIARVVRDADGDYVETAPQDLGRDVFFEQPSPEITPYGIGPTPPFGAAPRAPSDPIGAAMASIVNGAGFPIDPNTGVEAVGFSTRGVPVSLGSPTAWGSGAGAFYITDNHKHVYAVELGPLGEIRVGSLDGATATWR